MRRHASKKRRVTAHGESSLFYGVYLFQQAFRQFDFGFGGSTADEVLARMQKFRAEVLSLV